MKSGKNRPVFKQKYKGLRSHVIWRLTRLEKPTSKSQIVGNKSEKGVEEQRSTKTCYLKK